MLLLGMGRSGFLIRRFSGFYNRKEAWVKEVIKMNIAWMLLDVYVYLLTHGNLPTANPPPRNLTRVYSNKPHLYINNKKRRGKGYTTIHNSPKQRASMTKHNSWQIILNSSPKKRSYNLIKISSHASSPHHTICIGSIATTFTFKWVVPRRTINVTHK